jgi:acetyltransferase-like isoleucine patch superfamily enzyme
MARGDGAAKVVGTIMRAIIKLLFRFVLWAAYAAYQAEGINALLLLMPAKFIVPTLRQHGAQIGERAEIHSPLIIHNASAERGKHYANLKIGNDCYFGRDVFFDLKDAIRIEENVTVSMRVTFITHTDVGKSPVAARLPASHAPIVIKRGAYLGAGVTVLQGAEIGAEAIVGAGALVRENVEAGTTVGGVPARTLRGQEA